MKKAMMVGLALLLIFCMSVPVLAEGFVQSPSLNQAPVVEDVQAEGVPEGTEFTLVVTPYTERGDLTEEQKNALVDAYDEIKQAEDLTVLTPELAELVQEQDLNSENLAVSDLFDITPNTDEHGQVTVKLGSEYLQNFVALLHKKDNNWDVVDSAKVVNGDSITFSVDDFSPFAIVVETEKETPDTGDSNLVYVWVILGLCAAVAAVCFAVKAKKSANK